MVAVLSPLLVEITPLHSPPPPPMIAALVGEANIALWAGTEWSGWAEVFRRRLCWAGWVFCGQCRLCLGIMVLAAALAVPITSGVVWPWLHMRLT